MQGVTVAAQACLAGAFARMPNNNTSAPALRRRFWSSSSRSSRVIVFGFSSFSCRHANHSHKNNPTRIVECVNRHRPHQYNSWTGRFFATESYADAQSPHLLEFRLFIEHCAGVAMLVHAAPRTNLNAGAPICPLMYNSYSCLNLGENEGFVLRVQLIPCQG